MPPRPALLPPLAAALFLLSGAIALVYQVIWFRRLAHAFGSSSLAGTAVLAGFLLGLGLGAWAFGRLADRLRRPLFAYGLLEVGIALYALAFGTILDLANRGLLAFYPLLEDAPGLHALARLAVAFFVLAPPCALMGATLPMLVRALASPLVGLGLPTAWMYAANTCGAALGCYLAGFHLLPALGLVRTLQGAVAVNLLVAGLALVLGRRVQPGAPARGPVAAEDPALRAGRSPRAIELAACAAGAGALVLQIAWIRQLALVLGGTTYAFSAMLFVVLLGIGVGSLAAPLLLGRRRSPARVAVLLTLAIAAVTLLGQAPLPALAEWVGAARMLRGTDLGNAAVCLGASALLELLPSLGAGLLFPLLVEATGSSAARAGSTVGRLYAWNTLGTTLGAVTAHALLVPRLGTDGAVAVAVVCYLAVGWLAVGVLGPAESLRWRALLVVAGAAGLLLAPRHDPRALERGLYLYGLEGRDVLADAEVLFHRAGASMNVLVTGHGPHRSLRVNGKVDASTFEADQRTQLGTAYLPRFLHPDARRVLVIGHGSGATSGASLLFPGTEVTSVEIEPAVADAARHFERINHSPERSPGFRLRIEDGRAHLAGTRERYDLILTEPSNPWIAGIANLFTREFYLAARARLEPGGVLGQWIQTYALSERDYVSVVRTILDVFEHGALLRLTSGDTMLLASDRPLGPDAATARRAQALVSAQPRVRADLVATFRSDDVRGLLAHHLLLDDAGVRALASSVPDARVLTDADLRLEFDAPRRLFLAPEDEPGAALETALLRHLDPAAYGERLRAMEAGPAQLGPVIGIASLLRHRGHEAAARGMLAQVLTIDPDQPLALAGLLALAPEERFEERARRLVDLDPATTLATAADLARRQLLEPALALLDHLAATTPPSATLELRRAELLERLARPQEGQAARTRALELDPLAAAPRTPGP